MNPKPIVKGMRKLTGAELIAYIQNNQLEDYTFVVSHETGEGAYSIKEVIENHNEGTIELC